MDKNMNTIISFLIKLAVKIYTLYYAFRYNNALYRSKNQNKRISRQRFSEQNKDRVGLKNTQVSLEKLIVQNLGITTQFFINFSVKKYV